MMINYYMISTPASLSAIFDTNLQKTIYHSISSSHGAKDVLSVVFTPHHNCSIINSKSFCANSTRLFLWHYSLQENCSIFNTYLNNSN
jgi:hypothetical protein